MTDWTGQIVAFTGRLASMTRAEARALVEQRGGRVSAIVSPATTLLVLGQHGWPLRPNGKVTRRLQQARMLQRQGSDIEIVGEEVFLERLEGHSSDVCRECTLPQLVRLLDVPRARVAAWIRSGFLQPARTVHRMPYFDYQQVSGARVLAGLLSRGVRRERIEKSLRQLRRWLPQAEATLGRLSLLAETGVLATRRDDGRLVDPAGQLLLDFEPLNEGGLPFERPLMADELFERAVALDEAERYQEAAECYGEWLDRFGPDADAWFNRGNCLAALGRPDEAERCYAQAVAADARFAQAWNNLGNVLADREAYPEALAALRRALEIDPGYFDAHYNLAQTLEALGRRDEARRHWRAYLQFDRHSPWAQHALDRLKA